MGLRRFTSRLRQKARAAWRWPVLFVGERLNSPGEAKRPTRRHLLAVESLEGRDLMSVSPLSFGPFQTARVSQAISVDTEVDLYSVALGAGDRVEASVNAKNAGSGLASLLRVFDAAGNPLALDDPDGTDPRLTFQVPTSGTYLVGVSGTGGGSTGLYTLDLRRTPQAAALPDLAPSSFRLGAETAVPGESLPLRFAIENRGTADPGNFRVEVLLSDSNRPGASSVVLASFARAELAVDGAGRFLSPAVLAVPIPLGLAFGRNFVVMRIVADPSVPLLERGDRLTPRVGINYEEFTLLAPLPVGTTSLAGVAPDLNARAVGNLPNQAATETYPFTVSPALGIGRLTATVANLGGSLAPRLTLIGPQGEIVVQSDDGRIVQYLPPGTYSLRVSARSGTGGYRLETQFVRTSRPDAALPAGASPGWPASGDVNNDGRIDLVIGNRVDQNVAVYLGNGDGTFRTPLTFPIDSRLWKVTLADVNGDGMLDILTPNKATNSVSVLLGNGDGTFQARNDFPVGIRPGDVNAADVNGDGKADLIVSNYASDTVGVLLGNGDGTFQPQQLYPTDDQGRFQGPGDPKVADLNGDGIPDLVYPTYIGANVVVRLGLGDGTFGGERKFATGTGSYNLEIVDVNGDGRPDVVTANAVADTVSVLLGNGDGTFRPAINQRVGLNPYTLTVADFNGDGRPDFATANRGDNTVSVLLGNGDGTLRPMRSFPTDKTPRGITAGDFNGDGFPDLATANQGADTGTVLLGRGDGTFTSAGQENAPAPSLRPFGVASADLNGDGRPDIVTANRPDNTVSVLLSNPDGSFQTRETFPTDRAPFNVALGDVNGDGVPDLATANYEGSSTSVLLGNGDGTFQPRRDIPVGTSTYGVTIADVNGDGFGDVLVTNKNDNNVGVLISNGDGTFRPMLTFDVASGPYVIAVKDLNADGKPDLVVSHFSAEVIDVLLGNGDGTFLPTRQFPVGSRPYGVAIADFDGDGVPDIVTANYRSSNASVLLGNGDGTFQLPRIIPVGRAPNRVLTADLDGDGNLDFVTANYGTKNVSVLLGNGDGTFRQQTFAAGIGPASVAVQDLDGDGNLDLVAGNRNASTVNVLYGNGDGTFRGPVPFGAGKNRYAVAVADLNGDSHADLVTSSVRQGAITVQLGDGTGTFQPGRTLSIGSAPTSLSLGDLNGDGRLDLVTSDSGGDSLSVALGNGDGSFQPARAFGVGRSPRSVQIADLNGDGIPDLVATNYQDGTVSVLLGSGAGAFQSQQVFQVGQKPYSLNVADVNGDGELDLVVTNSADNTASVLLGDGDGGFTPRTDFATGRHPFAATVADLNGDGKLDLAVANSFDDSVSFLRGNGDGTFQIQRVFVTRSRPYSVAAADVNGDGKPDLITTDYGNGTVSLLLGDGQGNFTAPGSILVDTLPVQSVVADVNTDGRPDLVTVSNQNAGTGVLLGKGNGTFQTAAAASVGLRNTAALVDLDGDSIPDRLVLDRSGEILFRKGLGGLTNAFAPPRVLNPGRPARDFVMLFTGSGVVVAADDAGFDPALSVTQLVFSVSLYQITAEGVVLRYTAFSSPDLAARLQVADLDGNGLPDLIAANPLDDNVTIAFQRFPLLFGPPVSIPVGMGPADIAVLDVNGDRRPDLVVSNQASGDASVLLNDATQSFGQTLRFRAATGIYGVDPSSAATRVLSVAQSVSLAAGDFTGDGVQDVVVVNRGAHGFTVLPGNGQGGFRNPLASLTTSTSDGARVNQRPGEVVAGDFNRDGKLDLAVLMEDTNEVWIYTGSGDGGFVLTSTLPAGDQATGLSLIAGSGVGLFDLLIGNGFGDLLRLEGKGDGTFQIRGKRVSLSVISDLFGPGKAGVLVGNQQDNRVTVQTQTGGQFSTVQTLSNQNASSQLAPGDVQFAILSQDAALPDAIVASTGSNAVVVYRTLAITGGVPTFAAVPQTFFVGTSPAGVTAKDLNGDGIRDLLVANQGSNDVSVIFGSYDADGAWVGTTGPRLRSGGDGPIAVTARSFGSGGRLDLVITNGSSGTMTLLPGVGQGFFDDRQPATLFDFREALLQAPVFVGTTGVGVALTAGGNLVRFDLDRPELGTKTVFSEPGLVALQVLPNGQLVVASANGRVKILTDRGDRFEVTAELVSQSGEPVLPSSLVVVQKAGGDFDVLVSSQGSDTVFAFGLASPTPIPPPIPAPGGSPIPGNPAPSVPSFPSSPTTSPGGGTGSSAGGGFTSTTPVSSNSAPIVVTLNNGIAGISQGASATTASSSTSSVSTSVSSSSTSAGGPSLGSFASADVTGRTREDSAVIVSVQGNSYSTVAVLGFGAQTGEEEEDDTARMPDLPNRRPFGSTSPRTRLAIGQEEAVEEYREAMKREIEGLEGNPDDSPPGYGFDWVRPSGTVRDEPPLKNDEAPKPAPRVGSSANPIPEEASFTASPSEPTTDGEVFALPLAATFLGGVAVFSPGVRGLRPRRTRKGKR